MARKTAAPTSTTSSASKAAPTAAPRPYANTLDIQELEVALSATPQQDDVVKLFAYNAVGDVQKRGNVSKVDIIGWIELILPLVKTIITRCREQKVQNTLATVKARPNGLQARLLRQNLKKQIQGGKLSDQEKYELVSGVVNQGVACLDDREMWDGLYGRFAGWKPVTESAPAHGGDDEAEEVPPQPGDDAESAE